MKIYLAGDSLLQDYKEEEFIAGWGQYLAQMACNGCQVVNFAKGGRSSRLFINEGRFDEIDLKVSKGDYLFIEFCHNDDESKEYKTMFNRLVSLGMPDEQGRYPIIPGELMDKDYIPQQYLDALNNDDSIDNKQLVIDSVLNMFASYPHERYYPYSANGAKGSYKWFLKQYVDMAREHEAIPVLVTAVARTAMDEEGHIKDGAGLHGGNDFAYIRAMRQLGEEANVPVLDLFEASRKLFESYGKDKVHYLMSIKKGKNKGTWPQDYDAEMRKAETVSEDTHLNKYGAYLITKELAKLIMNSENKQIEPLKKHIDMDIEEVKKPECL